MPVIYYGEEVGKKGKRDKYVGNEAWDHDEHIREPMLGGLADATTRRRAGTW